MRKGREIWLNKWVGKTAFGRCKRQESGDEILHSLRFPTYGLHSRKGPWNYCTRSLNEHLDVTLSKKKQKQRITLHYIEFTRPFRKHSLKTYSVLSTVTGDKLLLKGSNSRYFRLCGLQSLLQPVSPTNVAATDNIERNGLSMFQ